MLIINIHLLVIQDGFFLNNKLEQPSQDSWRRNLAMQHAVKREYLHFTYMLFSDLYLFTQLLWFSLCFVSFVIETPMLEGEEDDRLRLWHLVKSSEDPEIPKHRKSSMRERERAKAIPEIYLTRLLSMKVVQ